MKILIAYFLCGGVTKRVVKSIAELIKGDLMK